MPETCPVERSTHPANVVRSEDALLGRCGSAARALSKPVKYFLLKSTDSVRTESDARGVGP